MKPSLTRSARAALAASLAAAAATACAPRIYDFRVAPTLLCGRDTAVATWRVRGTPALMISLGDPRLQGNPASTAPDTLLFTLVATSGSKESLPRRQEVLRFAPELRAQFAAGNLRREAAQAVWVDTVDAARWDSTRFRLATVTSAADRPLELRHAGRVVALPPRGSSSALAGAPAGGEWEFRSALTPAELQGGPIEPEDVQVSGTLRCRPHPTP
ncbi:MAG TPA: hypothetical protein VM890_07840 [Longimicrobium sp.]|nr:hypothetical protein [Longimicrobium sp.]